MKIDKKIKLLLILNRVITDKEAHRIYCFPLYVYWIKFKELFR